jgi:hypothetical protein
VTTCTSPPDGPQPAKATRIDQLIKSRSCFDGAATDSGENLFDHVASHVREAIIAPGMAERQFRVIEAEAVENRGVEIMNVAFLLGDVFAKFVRAPIYDTSLHSAPGQP